MPTFYPWVNSLPTIFNQFDFIMNRSFLNREKIMVQTGILKEKFQSRTKAEVWREYANDWLTVQRMAEHYNVHPNQLTIILQEGKKEHNSAIEKPQEEHGK
jgi:hypothetical protein